MVRAWKLLHTHCLPQSPLSPTLPSAQGLSFLKRLEAGETWMRTRPAPRRGPPRRALLANARRAERPVSSERGIFPSSFLCILHKSHQDAQARVCGLPCGSPGCQRIKYKVKLRFFPFHTRAIHSTGREAAACPRARGVR